MADNNLLNVKVKSGTFYISSKEDKGEGWTKQEFQNPQNKEETLVRYHKTLSIVGRLNHLAIDDDKYQGKVLKLIVGGEKESYALALPIMDTGGKVKTTNQYFNSLIGSLENVNKGDTITLFVNNKNKDKNDRLYRNIVTLNSEGKLVKSNFSFSDVPKWNSTEETDDFGETVTQWDASPTNKFYIDKAKEVVANFKSEETTETATSNTNETADPGVQEKTPSKETAKTTSAKKQNNDLPF